MKEYLVKSEMDWEKST